MKPYPGQEKVKELVLSREWKKAEEILESTRKEGDFASVLNDLALVKAKGGELDQAVALIKQALSRSDSDILVELNHFYLTRLKELNRSRGDDARRRVIELKLGNPELKPKISIIMRTRNRGELIRESIESVLAQSFPAWELLIVNDGGDREVEKILESLWDQRMVYAYAEHSGPAGALNTGLRLSRGDWIGFLDDDDLYDPKILENLFHWLPSHPEAKVVYANSRVVWREQKSGKMFKSQIRIPGEFQQERLWRNNFIGNIFAFFLNRKCLEKVPGVLEGLRNSMDWEFYLALSQHFPFHYLPVLAGERKYIEGLEQIGKRSFRERNLMRNLILYYHGRSPFFSFGLSKSGLGERFQKELKDFLGRFPELISALELRKLFKEPAYAFFYELGVKLAKEGRISEARVAYNCARKIAPTELKTWTKWLRTWF